MFTSFLHWLRPPARRAQAQSLYIALVAQARQPFFYEQLEVPDTIDGRFDMILLHVFLFTHRLRTEESREAHALAAAITDLFFGDMDRNLREMGVGDLSVGKKIRKMADALNGRFVAYTNAIGDAEALGFALMRNVYGTVKPAPEHPAQLADYCLTAAGSLARQPLEQLVQQPIAWPSLNH